MCETRDKRIPEDHMDQIVTEQGQKTEENTAAEADNSEDSLSGQSKLHDQVKETDKN